jgi:hypothetical protein
MKGSQMEVYSNIPADAIADLDARFSALAAQIAQDDRPEPEPPAGGAAAKRSRYDNLTSDERQRLYDATAYQVVEAATGGEWRVSHREVDAVFTVRKSGERGVALVISNTGNEYRVNLSDAERACPCPDAGKKAERGDGRDCKHAAAARAVVLHHRAKRDAEEAARAAVIDEKFRRNRERLAAYIERERTSRRLAA